MQCLPLPLFAGMNIENEKMLVLGEKGSEIDIKSNTFIHILLHLL
jgi:hypothetical protein